MSPSGRPAETVRPGWRPVGELRVDLGTIPVTFADSGIANPSGGPALVGDDGEVEVLLVFAKGP